MIKVNYIRLNQEESRYFRVNHPEGSGDWLFLFFLSPMHVTLSEEILPAEEGGVLILPPGARQDFTAVGEFRLSFIHFEASMGELFSLPVSQVFYPENRELLTAYLTKIDEEYNTREPFFEEAVNALMSQMFLTLARETFEEAFPSLREQSLYRLFLKARYIMLSNCEKEWASTNMPEMVSLSRSQFYKYYTSFFGVSPMQDLTRARIEMAKNLLINEQLSVTEVSERCGYSSIHHFSRTFKEHTGLSPVAYVRSVKWL